MAPFIPHPDVVAALATLTVVGLLVTALIQHQVKLYMQSQHQGVPGNQGETATPTAAEAVALFAPVMMVRLSVDKCTGDRRITG
jgi:hypothetical protein